jgi:hypothetical protein
MPSSCASRCCETAAVVLGVSSTVVVFVSPPVVVFVPLAFRGTCRRGLFRRIVEMRCNVMNKVN